MLATARLDAPARSARRILRGAARPVTPIDAVLAPAPTVTIGAANAASTINGQATSLGAGTYQANDLNVVEHVGGRLVANGGGYAGQGMTGNRTTLALRATHGQGIRFATDAQALDVCVNAGNVGFVIYVTDVATGIRGRTPAADLTTGDFNYHYVKLEFASRAVRIIEVYIQNVGLLRGINTDAAGSIWRSPSADEPRLVLIGDSFSSGQGSGASNTTRLTFPHFMAQRLGVTNIYCSADGGTGYLNPGSRTGRFESGSSMAILILSGSARRTR